MTDKTQLYGAHPESPTAVLCSCAPRIAQLDERIAKLEALVVDGADTKAAVMEMRDLLRQFAPAMASVADVVKALDLPPHDPEATPNMRGGR